VERERLFERGMELHFSRNNPCKAASLFRRLTELFSGDDWYWFRLGDALHDAGQERHVVGWSREATGAYKEAIRIAPDNPYWYWNLGILYKDLGRLDEARRYWAKAEAVAPEGTLRLYHGEEDSDSLG
jgi:tetratricopeptide (TPR) repeat protein